MVGIIYGCLLRSVLGGLRCMGFGSRLGVELLDLPGVLR